MQFWCQSGFYTNCFRDKQTKPRQYLQYDHHPQIKYRERKPPSGSAPEGLQEDQLNLAFSQLSEGGKYISPFKNQIKDHLLCEDFFDKANCPSYLCLECSLLFIQNSVGIFTPKNCNLFLDFTAQLLHYKIGREAANIFCFLHWLND